MIKKLCNQNKIQRLLAYFIQGLYLRLNHKGDIVAYVFLYSMHEDVTFCWIKSQMDIQFSFSRKKLKKSLLFMLISDMIISKLEQKKHIFDFLLTSTVTLTAIPSEMGDCLGWTRFKLIHKILF